MQTAVCELMRDDVKLKDRIDLLGQHGAREFVMSEAKVCVVRLYLRSCAVQAMLNQFCQLRCGAGEVPRYKSTKCNFSCVYLACFLRLLCFLVLFVTEKLPVLAGPDHALQWTTT